LIGVREARIKRHGEHGTATRFAHLQAEPSRPRAPTQHHGNVEAADLDLDGLATPKIKALKHCYAPYCRRPLDSAADTVAQAFEGARASALGSAAEGSCQHPSTSLVLDDKIADFRRYLGPESGAVEHAV